VTPDGVPGHDRITLIGLLLEASLGLQREFDPFSEEVVGVGGQAFAICIRLVRSGNGTMRMADLATQTGMSPSGLTRAIDRLVEKGLVRRKHSESDRRGSFAVLTGKGRERICAAVELRRSKLDELLDGLCSPEEEALFAEVLIRLRNRVNPPAACQS